MTRLLIGLLLLQVAALPALAAHSPTAHGFKALVFSKTAGFRHASIEAGQDALADLAAEHEFQVEFTEDAGRFSTDSLAGFDLVIFLNTTGDVLDADQQGAFEAFIRAGGGFVGIHSASDTEYDWPFYGELVGAYFESHPPGTTDADIKVVDRFHPSTSDLPTTWGRTDEWYNFASNPRGNVHVLATLEESSYSGGTMGWDHPIAWCHEYEGGRSWYTAGGHTSASYSEPDFRTHLTGGIEWAAGASPGDCSGTVWSNFERVVLDGDVVNPMSLEVTADGRILYIERSGNLKLLDPETGLASVAGTLDVVTSNEDGLLGLVLDPGFDENGWLYLFYSPQGSEPIQRVSRFTLVNGELDMGSEQVLLTIPVQRDECCHSAGSMAFDASGNLFIATGDNTNPFESGGYAPIDERAGRGPWDAQKSSGNTADLRGKILRITPQPDGSYTIPEGNLFDDSADGAPEVYIMGLRNPFRISVDPVTGWLYWGDVGPDSRSTSSARGPLGYDEFNQAREAGNHGWPFCIADNQPYRDYDFATGASGDWFDCSAPVNDSPNNTGAELLPPAQPAWIWYPYSASPDFPFLTGGSGRTAMAGPVYRLYPRVESDSYLPEYYEGSLFIYEWAQDWIKEVKMDENGDLLAAMPFLPDMTVRRPIDLKMGPDGALYLLEWGSGFSGNNPDSRLSRIRFLRSTRAPVIEATADPLFGPAPLTVQFDASRSYHPEPGTPLTFEWDFESDGTVDAFETAPSYTYESDGSYTATLVVSDDEDNRVTTRFSIVVGNTPPEVTLARPAQGTFFQWGRAVDFEVQVRDAEDGTTENGDIDCDRVTLQLFLGHNAHAHPLNEEIGCSGTFDIPVEDHGGEGDRLFYVVEAAYEDEGNGNAGSVRGYAEHVLQPSRLEAEYYTEHSGIILEEGNDVAGGRRNLAYIDHGDWVSYEDVDLSGIFALTFRVASAGTGGTISVRTGSVDGPELGSVHVAVTGNWQSYNDVTLMLDEETPEGLNELFLVFENRPGDSGLFNVNWIDFHGPGVHSPEQEQGLQAVYYADTALTQPVLQRVDPQISFDWQFDRVPGLAPGASFGAQWSGLVTPEESGWYRFYSEASGSMRVWLDGELVVDGSAYGGGILETRGLTRPLDAGTPYRIEAEYLSAGGEATARLEWMAAPVPRSSVPFALLTPAAFVTAVENSEPVPASVALEPVYPNPAHGSATVGFTLERAAEVRLTLFDVLGRSVRTAAAARLGAGRHELPLEISGLASGLYAVELESEGRSVRQQFAVIR